MGFKKTERIRKEVVSRYEAHEDCDGFVIDYLSSRAVHEYDDNAVMMGASIQCFDEMGTLHDSYKTTRRAHEKGYIYEWYDHRGELEGHIICDKDGREIESTLLGQHQFIREGDKLIKQISTYHAGVTNEFSYVYDTDRKIIQSIETRNGVKRVVNHYYSRDIMGNLVETCLDEEGSLIRTEVMDKLYGHLIESKEMSDGNPSAYDISHYRKNLCNVSLFKFVEQELVYSHIRHLEFDAKGNWITAVEKTDPLNGTSVCISIREIQYLPEEEF